MEKKCYPFSRNRLFDVSRFMCENKKKTRKMGKKIKNEKSKIKSSFNFSHIILGKFV